MEYVNDFLDKNIPSIKSYRPESTFLMWLDFRQWNMEHKDIIDFLVNKAGLGLNDGLFFGEEGRGFMRLNIGAPRSVIIKALNQLKEAVETHNIK